MRFLKRACIICQGVQVATAKAAKAGESLSTDFKLKYVTPVNRAAVTIEHLPAMKQVRLATGIFANTSVYLPLQHASNTTGRHARLQLTQHFCAKD